MTKIERARAMAIAAGVDPAEVAGEPVEVDFDFDDYIVTWGMTGAQAKAVTDSGRDWFNQYPEVRMAHDVFTWQGLPRWTVWVDTSLLPFPV